jgi:hypothetical protein
VVSGQWSVVSGQWSVVSGQWSVVSGQWSVVSDQWSVDSGQRSCGLRVRPGPLPASSGVQQDMICWSEQRRKTRSNTQHPTPKS